MDLCQCPTSRTRALVTENNNICPTCAKPLIDNDLLEPSASHVPKQEETGEEIKQLEQITKLFEAFSKASTCLTKGRNEDNKTISLKPPHYSGKANEDVRHFYFRLRQFFDYSKVTSNKDKIRILT